MSATNMVIPSRGYYVTLKGHEAIDDPEVCRCTPKLVGLILECPLCGTVFGHTRDMFSFGGIARDFKR